jgi:mannosyl-3-phosphoglycerate phosphatase
MDIEEIIKITGLPEKSVKLLLQRAASIPFIPSGSSEVIDIKKTNSALEKHGVLITRGGRFYHLISTGADKGSAVRKVTEYMKRTYSAESIITAGIGDNESDLSMLKAVDIPFLVRKPDGSVIKADFEVTVTVNIGPRGFTEAVKQFSAVDGQQLMLAADGLM